MLMDSFGCLFSPISSHSLLCSSRLCKRIVKTALVLTVGPLSRKNGMENKKKAMCHGPKLDNSNIRRLLCASTSTSSRGTTTYLHASISDFFSRQPIWPKKVWPLKHAISADPSCHRSSGEKSREGPPWCTDRIVFLAS